MRETNETALVVKNDSFFERLKEFLKMFFGINGKYALKNEEELNENARERRLSERGKELYKQSIPVYRVI